jgi:alkanesulfonate monooxygenase SsuD/methylene tetrahydromethanopterin reductase-like flavin-dependent oxidoreductase (luciferase family)
MRLSIAFTGFGALEPTVPIVKAAQDAGFEGVWTAEHLGFHDAIVPSAVYVREAPGLDIGLVGLATAGRHPALTAMELGSLSELAPGRVRAAIGTGDAGLIGKLGKTLNKPVDNVARFVRSLKETLVGRDMKESHPEFTFDGFRMAPLGPAPAIDVMAIRPRMVAMAAQVADGLSISVGASKQYLRETVALVESELAAAGRSRNDFRITALAMATVGDDKDSARGPLPAMLAMFPQDTAAYLARGVVDAEALVAAERDGGPFAVMKMWTPEAVDQIALVATPDTIAAELAAYAATGIDELALTLLNPPEEQPQVVKHIAAARP